MCIEKMTEDGISIVCRCGAEREISISDLEVKNNSVPLPVCECGFSMFVNLAQESRVKGNKHMHVINHTLAKRLVEMGRGSADSSRISLAENWESGKEMVCHLHNAFDKARSSARE